MNFISFVIYIICGLIAFLTVSLLVDSILLLFLSGFVSKLWNRFVSPVCGLPEIELWPSFGFDLMWRFGSRSGGPSCPDYFIPPQDGSSHVKMQERKRRLSSLPFLKALEQYPFDGNRSISCCLDSEKR